MDFSNGFFGIIEHLAFIVQLLVEAKKRVEKREITMTYYVPLTSILCATCKEHCSSFHLQKGPTT